MNIWILNHYAVPIKYYHLARSYNFTKRLIKSGNTVTIFGASSVHNSDINLIEDGSLYTELEEDGIQYVLFRGRQYKGTGKDRVINHIDVAYKMWRHCSDFIEKYGRPDVIFASAGQSLTLVAGIFLAKKLGIRCISEITDLWPESFVAYGIVSPKNLLLKPLYAGERWIYKRSDAVIFSMEGGKDYILEKKWDTAQGGPIELKKVFHINNGVDLEEFDFNKKKYQTSDIEINDGNRFKVVYTGSVRLINDLGMLLDVAELLQKKGNNNVQIIIYGDGDQRERLMTEAVQRGLQNIIFRGRIAKQYIPYILSNADLCLLHWKPTSITRYGMSMNKTFEYFAAGKPILSTSLVAYDLVDKYQAGISTNITTAEEYVEKILYFANMDSTEREQIGKNARKAAEDYDYEKLTKKLLKIIGE